MDDLPDEGMYRIDNIQMQCPTTLQGNTLHGLMGEDTEDDLPDEGMYRIDSIQMQCPTILQENTLHGLMGEGTQVVLDYINREEGLCTLRVGENYLGVEVMVHNETPVMLVHKQRWILQRKGDGITIRHADEPEGVQYFWRLYRVGPSVLIHNESLADAQTWSFNLPE